MTQTFKLSPSALNLMQECPKCFWLTLHKVWKRPAGIFPSLPSGMDRILKTHFNKFREKNQLPPELCEKDGCQNLKLFNNEGKLKIWQNNRKGIQWADKKGNILKGAIDNILINKLNKKLIVLDYKTRGYPLKDDTAEHYRLQLDIYNFLLKKNNYDIEDYAFLLFYVPREVLATGEILFDTELVKMPVSGNRGKKVFDEAIELLNEKCPKKHEDCPWCVNIEV